MEICQNFTSISPSIQLRAIAAPKNPASEKKVIHEKDLETTLPLLQFQARSSFERVFALALYKTYSTAITLSHFTFNLYTAFLYCHTQSSLQAVETTKHRTKITHSITI